MDGSLCATASATRLPIPPREEFHLVFLRLRTPIPRDKVICVREIEVDVYRLEYGL